MAKGSFLNFPAGGSLGDYSIYKRKDSDKWIIRAKGGATAEKFWKDPKMAVCRLNAKTFGGASTIGKSIRDAMLDVAELGHSQLSGDINSVVSKIRKLSPVNAEQDQVIFSNGLHLLQGFNLNRVNVFDAVVSTPLQSAINRITHKATLQLPQLTPGMNLKNPWSLPYFRFVMNFGIIRDMYFDGTKYRTMTPNIPDHTILESTEWASVNVPHPAQSFDFQFDNPVFDEHCYLMLSAGIEFGRQVEGGIGAVPDASCGKIVNIL